MIVHVCTKIKKKFKILKSTLSLNTALAEPSAECHINSWVYAKKIRGLPVRSGAKGGERHRQRRRT
jgi:hypothetical protein